MTKVSISAAMAMSIIDVTAKIAVSCIPSLNLKLSKGLPRSLLIIASERVTCHRTIADNWNENAGISIIP